MKKIRITRFKNVSDGTLGRLDLIDYDVPNTLGAVVFSCYTLEPRGEDETRPNLDKRIPAGRYSLKWHNSPKFKRRLLHLYSDKVPKSRYILIHSGNYPKDTLGCILLGKNYSDSGVFNSLNAFKEFNEIMAKSNVEEDILEIINFC